MTIYYGVPRERLAPLNTAELERREAERFALRQALKAACALSTPTRPKVKTPLEEYWDRIGFV